MYFDAWQKRLVCSVSCWRLNRTRKLAVYLYDDSVLLLKDRLIYNVINITFLCIRRIHSSTFILLEWISFLCVCVWEQCKRLLKWLYILLTFLRCPFQFILSDCTNGVECKTIETNRVTCHSVEISSPNRPLSHTQQTYSNKFRI